VTSFPFASAHIGSWAENRRVDLASGQTPRPSRRPVFRTGAYLLTATTTPKGAQMTAAIATSTQNALAELKALERAWQEAGQKASELAHEHTRRSRRLHRWLDDPGLLDQLAALQQRDPDQFGPAGEPQGPEAKALQKEIDTVGDPAELVPRLDHARRVEAKRKAEVDAFLRAHLGAVLDDLRPEGEAVAAEANQAAREFVEKLDRYIALYGRVATLVASVGRDTRAVPGLDAAADLRLTAERVELPAPVPEASREH
jgi:hypothetical protein